MSSIIPGYKKPTAGKTSKRKTLLYGAGVILVALCLLVGIYYYALNSVTGGKKDLKQVSAQLDELDKEPDCHKSLEKLKALGPTKISDTGEKKTEAVEKVIYYRIHCNNTIGDYEGALAAARELRDYYNVSKASDKKKIQATEMIESIELAQESERQDQQNVDKLGPPVKNNGPVL